MVPQRYNLMLVDVFPNVDISTVYHGTNIWQAKRITGVTLTSGGMICLAHWSGNSYLGVEVPHSPSTHIYVTYDADHATN